MSDERADLFYDICDAVGVSGAKVLRKALEDFIAEHADALDESPDQGRLPISA